MVATTKYDALYERFDNFLNAMLDNDDIPLKLYKPKTKDEYEEIIQSLN